MAYSKTFLLLGLLFAVVLILSSEVSARELAEAANTRSVEDAKHWGHGHGHGHEHGHGHWGHGHEHGHGHGHGHGHHGHGGAGETVENETEAGEN
ncbi:hypothetical protein PVL29_025753 [Vitis rotundifolia]|uniref:Phase-change related protein n=1 Tax=Vitis rotundifolia TaxID=103349 RepID=A0AA38YKT3_VITRO|nr:hypothetical protein PVL29_025753 [Vitis rotundifolia]